MGSDPKSAGVSMVKIGVELKAAREKKSVTIDQVQKQTRIHSTVLKSLEEGQCDGMLTPTYVRSFLKKYAEYLGLDSRQILNEYAKLRPATPALQIAIASQAERAPSIDFSKLFFLVRLAAVAAIVITLAIFIGGKAVSLLKRPKETRPVSAAKKPAAAARPAAALPVKKTAPKPAPAASAVVIPKTTPLKLLLKVNQSVLVKIKTDGNLLFSRVLTRGAVESFTAEDRINIYVAKGESIELFLNGKSLGSPGRGPIRNIEITRSGLKLK